MKQGETIPTPSQLCNTYLKELTPENEAFLKKHVEYTDVYLFLDETTDSSGHSVLAVLAQPLQKVGKKPLRIGAEFLQRDNHAAVSQPLLRVLYVKIVNFDKVLAVVTNSASYMIKAFNTILPGLFPNGIHITCIALLLNLILEICPVILEDLNTSSHQSS
uniref:DUF4371 domain-containing protein n=1 Tax=Callorhinchus milii TaxID=7868 RepID=A0A4W3HSA0_CALMI